MCQYELVIQFVLDERFAVISFDFGAYLDLLLPLILELIWIYYFLDQKSFVEKLKFYFS
jgi:hypothetical protein